MKRRVCNPRKAKKQGICDRDPDQCLETYEEVIGDYIRRFRVNARADRQFFKDCSFQKALRYAGRCMRSDGKRHGHHRRRTQETLFEVESVLQKCAEQMRACEMFHDLHELIYREIRPIDGVGPLLVYDAAISIGAHLGLNPDRIYLHSGTAKGAKAILGTRGRKTINRSEIPSAFLRLRCYEIEDCLCIYKDDLARIARQIRRANRRRTPRPELSRRSS